MNARERLAIMIRTDRGSMTVWSLSEARDALDAYRAEVVAERDATIVTWLVKKAREFRSMGGRMRAAQADAVAAMASKLERGAVRPDNLRMLPADFFKPGHGYTHLDGHDFHCVAVTTHPVTGEQLAMGWRSEHGDGHRPRVCGINQWRHEYDGVEPPAASGEES